MGNGIKYAAVYGPPSDIASINIETPPCPTPSPTPCPGDCPIPTPTVRFGSSSYSVDEGSSATVTVRLSQALSTSVAIPISVTRGTAESGDYTVGLNNGSITFANGVTQKTFTVTANHESDCDDETVKFAFGALPAGVGKGSPSKATLWIDDDETCPTPTSTVTPLPVPTGLTKGTQTLHTTGKHAGRRVLTLDWDDVEGTGIAYELWIRDAEKHWSCRRGIGPDPICEQLPKTDGASWIKSGGINFSSADYRYPVDGRVYEYQVRSVLGTETSAWSDVQTTTRQAAIPHVGHQEDHTVMYELGTGTFTSEISQSIVAAAKAWNDSSVGTSWPDLRICKKGSSGCESRNTDGHKVEIKVVGRLGCGDDIACVPHTKGEAFLTFYKDGGKSAPWQHMEDLEIRIENPAQIYDRDKQESTIVLWTLDYTRDNTRTKASDLRIYLPGLVMHEFGHTFGLYDLYEYSGDTYDYDNNIYPEYPGYLMTDHHVIADTMTKAGSRMPTPVLPRKDIDYVREVYRNGHGTEPH